MALGDCLDVVYTFHEGRSKIGLLVLYNIDHDEWIHASLEDYDVLTEDSTRKNKSWVCWL